MRLEHRGIVFAGQGIVLPGFLIVFLTRRDLYQIIGAAGIRNQLCLRLLHSLAGSIGHILIDDIAVFVRNKLLQIDTELEHRVVLFPAGKRVFRNILCYPKILGDRMVRDIHFAAVFYRIFSRMHLIRPVYRIDLRRHAVDVNLPNEVAIDIYLINIINGLLAGHSEYSCFSGSQGEISVGIHIHRYLDRSAARIPAVRIDDLGADHVTIMIFRAFAAFYALSGLNGRKQRLCLTVVLKNGSEPVGLVYKFRFYPFGQKLSDCEFIFLGNLKVKLNIQVGSAGAALEIEHIEIVGGMVRKGVIDPISVRIYPFHFSPVIFAD